VASRKGPAVKGASDSSRGDLRQAASGGSELPRGRRIDPQRDSLRGVAVLRDASGKVSSMASSGQTPPRVTGGPQSTDGDRSMVLEDSVCVLGRELEGTETPR
jgi:hypothetical protein